ncbi:hypothetical protein PGIGA_G00252490 [Pangasianodon gigas]|uniref:Uncharacterized protein n=1 Tax=Pangasianodon gigas TaxID=30993 RepID=A0ACC5WRW3_PANGG|nr:hypothetical protein [Pangasianodon gigas]
MGKGFRGTVKDFPGFNANSDAEALYKAMKGFGEEPCLILMLILGSWTLIVVSVLVKGFRGTVKDFPGFNANSDAEALYKAMKGFGSDKEAILDLVTSRSNAQRQEIISAYKSLYGKDLIEDLKYELTGKFERLIVSLMRPPAYHDAKEIRDAIKGAGTNERCLIEILASRTNEQIHGMVAAYKDAYGRDIEEDIVGDTSGHFKKMLVALLQGARDEDGVVYEDLVEEDAQHLYAAGEEQWGTDEAIFIMLLGNRSTTHLQLVFDKYQELTEKSIEDSIKSELSGDFESLMLAVVQCVRSRPMFFAKRLYKSMKGLGTDDNTLIRIMISRSEIDMLDIRECFRLRYEKSLHSMIQSVFQFIPKVFSGVEVRALCRTLEFFHSNLHTPCLHGAGFVHRGIVMLEQGARDEDGVVYEDLVEEDAQHLYAAGEEQWGTDEAIFIMLLGNRSTTHLQLVFDKYQELTEKSIEDSIKSELSGDFESLMLAVVQCVRSRPMFFAKRLYKSMKGLGTDDNTLIRIMISRSEIDMLDIRECFRLRYEKSLHSMIQDDTSGEYKRTLLKLCGGDDDVAGEFFPEAAQIAYKMWEISSMTKVQLRGTVHPCPDFDPASDAQDLRKAMKGFGTDEDTIINIVTKRSNAQRQEIRQVFKSLLGRDLMADLKSELSKNLCRLIMGLMMSPAEFDAKMMKKAMEGAGTDEHALIEILVTRSNQEIQAMCAAYQKAFKKSLEDAIHSDTSGHFCRILVSLAQGAREEGPADMAKVLEDSQALADACNADSDERIDKFMSILCTRSFPHLRKVFQEFVKCSNKDIEQIIKKEMSGDVKNAMFAIVRSVKNQPSYFADRLYKAMKGLGTDDRALIRIMVSRSEIDLFNIRKEFKDTHDASLHEFIQVETMVGDTSGDYRKTLLILCGGED